MDYCVGETFCSKLQTEESLTKKFSACSYPSKIWTL